MTREKYSMSIYKPRRSIWHGLCLAGLFIISVQVQAIDVSKDNALKIARDYLSRNQFKLGLNATDLATMIVTDLYSSAHNGVTHIYLRQTHKGLEIISAELSINIAKDGQVISVHNHFIRSLSRVKQTRPAIAAIAMVHRAAQHLKLSVKAPVTVKQQFSPNSLLLSPGGISRDDIPMKLVYQPDGDRIRLAWQSVIRLMDGERWLDIRLDAETGEILAQNNWVDHASYDVFPVPIANPEDQLPVNVQSTIIDPEDAIASPFGWHDSNAVSGAEFTTTRGNNVYAYEDTNSVNIPGSSADGGPALDFSYFYDPAISPISGTNQEAAIVNLFYWNNIIHDIFYQYGFDEVSGNFQENNYAKGGVGSDSVNAEAQDGGGLNNAGFATPPDGTNPRMQMYLWDKTTPNRDGDLSNEIIIHEYGHGISKRLAGGPANVNCLGNQEQMGEGWSDWFSMILTTKATDTDTTVRGVGTWTSGQQSNGNGIRPAPYATDMAVNNYTYNDISSLIAPHGVGFLWATMLWELQWELINHYGFDPDLYAGTGGNNLALQLVVDGLKMQPCSPGFVDGRDAILAADLVNNAGANQCLIWNAFARRGLGISASQGSSTSKSDGSEAFDLPLICLQTLKIDKTALAEVKSGDFLQYNLTVTNDTLGTLSDIMVTDALAENMLFSPGSATCDGTEQDGLVSFSLAGLSSGESISCNFKVKVLAHSSTQFFFDDMEGAVLWQASQVQGASNWTLNGVNAHSLESAWYVNNASSTTDTLLTTSQPILLSGSPVLSFWHDFNTEGTYDGGVVEISTDGNSWTDLGPWMIENAYNGLISTCCNQPLSGRNAFTGSSGGYIETSIDLSSFTGQRVWLRFRFGTDEMIGSTGWFIDDVKIIDEVLLTNQACVTANDASLASHQACSEQLETVVSGNADRLWIPLRKANGKVLFSPL